MFSKGYYKVKDGLEALVVQVRPLGQNQWILRGAIIYNGIYHIHTWDINGISHSGHRSMDLIEND